MEVCLYVTDKKGLKDLRGQAAHVAHRRNDSSFFLPELLLTLLKQSHHGKCTQSCRPLVPTEWGHSHGEAKGIRGRLAFYFSLPSEQAVNLCSAPAYLGACHPSPAQGERHHTPQPSLLLLLPPRTFPQLSSPWLTGGGGCRLNYSLRSISPKFAFICCVLSLLFCCVCFLSGSRSDSVSACCIVSYQSWHWFAIMVMQKRKRAFIGVKPHLQRQMPRAPLATLLYTCSVCVFVCVCVCVCVRERESQGSHRAPTH